MGGHRKPSLLSPLDHLQVGLPRAKHHRLLRATSAQLQRGHGPPSAAEGSTELMLLKLCCGCCGASGADFATAPAFVSTSILLMVLHVLCDAVCLGGCPAARERCPQPLNGRSSKWRFLLVARSSLCMRLRSRLLQVPALVTQLTQPSQHLLEEGRQVIRHVPELRQNELGGQASGVVQLLPGGLAGAGAGGPDGSKQRLDAAA